MILKKSFIFIGIVSLVSVGVPVSSHADSPASILPVESHKSYVVPIGIPITSNDLEAISEMNLTFKYAGAECKFKSVAGCTVIKSTNPSIPVGLVVKAIATRTNGSMATNAAFRARCSWCSVAGDFIAITLFVVFAPASAPVAIVVATYSVGVGIILGHA
jgi:hypothetical protein